MNTASPLSVAGLRKTYGGKEVVCGVDLTLQPGECFGLLGPNGAGKTTTLRLCLGLTGPDGGSIQVLGHEVPQQGREHGLQDHRLGDLGRRELQGRRVRCSLPRLPGRVVLLGPPRPLTHARRCRRPL
jgi:ABC-type cobalamin/Fe3+-siderophores transport system ATPase subunit